MPLTASFTPHRLEPLRRLHSMVRCEEYFSGASVWHNTPKVEVSPSTRFPSDVVEVDPPFQGFRVDARNDFP